MKLLRRNDDAIKNFCWYHTAFVLKHFCRTSDELEGNWQKIVGSWKAAVSRERIGKKQLAIGKSIKSNRQHFNRQLIVKLK
jgi:hypothetical protein